MIRNDNSKYLITELIRIQDICGKTDAFWNIWELLKPYLLALSSKPQISFADRHPYGLDKVIISYLFGNSPGDPAFTDAPSFQKEKRLSLTILSTNREVSKPCSTRFPAALYRWAEPYIENGIDWMYKLVTRDPDCRLPLYQQTLYYMESTSVFCITPSHGSGTMWNWL